MGLRKRIWRGAASVAAIAFAASIASVETSQAQSSDTGAGPVEKVVVTGSHIKRSRESTALPVDVVTAQDLEKEGAPTIVDVAKALPVSNGVIGDTNQFDARAQGSEGTASINLRGLGPTRTLILLNGRRLSLNPFGLAGQGIVDTNIIPVAALDRIEVLKDGAAVTYGSDAIGGVINFITKKGYDGLGLAGDWRFINDADGDYSARGVYGYDDNDLNVLFSVGWHHRSELDALDRDFTQSTFAQNAEGGYSGAGNPGTFAGVNGAPPPVTVTFLDPGCGVLGGTPDGVVCRTQYIDFDNLQEEEDKLQLFSSVNYNLTQHTRLFMDALFATTDVPHWETTPLYAILTAPSAEVNTAAPVTPGFGGTFFVPTSNPYLANFQAAHPSLAVATAGGAIVVTNPPLSRPAFLGGNPLMPGGASQVAERGYEAFRVSGGIEGDLSESLSYELALTYSRQFAHRNGFDTMTNRYALALRGLGGPNCDKEPNTPGIQGPGGGPAVPGLNGCQYWNPFSTSIPRNVLTGQTNPAANAGGANDPAVLGWFMQELSTDQTAELFVADALMSGSTGIELWADEPIEFAVGAQYRRDSFVSTYNDLTNALKNPCVSSPDFFNHTCSGAARNGPFVFLGVATPADLWGDAYALFGEFAIPMFKNLDIQLAARFEDYGGEIGSTFDPKISARWQVSPWLALRGSAGSTFRGPPIVQLTTNNITSLQFIGGTFRAVDIGGNPGLQPESAETFSLGAIVTLKWFRGSLDYWGFDFENPIIGEPIGGMVATMFPGGGAGNCGLPAFAGLQARFTFSGGVCSQANIQRVQTFFVNGSPVVTKGFDFLGEAKLGSIIDGDLGLGGTFTYVREYHVDPVQVAGLTVAPAFEASGFLNYQTTAYPIPKWKGSAYLEYESQMHGLRLTVNYVDSYIDARNIFAVNPRGKEIEEFITVDMTYRLMLMDNLMFLLAVDNMFDEDPPFARLDLSYDPLTANTLGRTFKVGVRKEF